MKKIVVSCFCIFVCLTSFGQGRAKYGKVSMKEMQMDFYDQDSSASAVILSDYGLFNGDEFKFTRHVRVKILKKEGLRFGNWTLRTPTKGFFKGTVYNLENGALVEEKLSENTVHKQQIIDDVYVYKVFMPNVKVGSVIDLKYSYYGMPYDWWFQYLIPVVYSELKINPNNYLKFSKQFFGFEELKLVGPDHWICRNIPAFVKEPYINHYSNYVAKIEINILELRFPGRESRYYMYYPRFKEYTTSWEKVGKNLYEDRYFGQQIRGATFLSKPANQIKKTSDSHEEIIDKVYAYVQNNIKWNDVNTIYTLGTIRDNFENDKSGSISEINLALVSMLKRAGIEAWPVVLSTVNNGMLLPHSPSLNKLNYVIAYAEYDGKSVVLDASQNELRPGILPVKCLNGPGWLVDNDGGRWVDLRNKKKKSIKKYTKIKCNEDDDWEGVVSVMRNDYAYLKWKEENKKSYSLDEYLSKFETANEKIQIRDYKILKNDSIDLKLTEQFKLKIEDFLIDLGDEYVMDPYLIKEVNTNIFKSLERKYPVFFQTLPNFKHTVVIEIPEKIKVLELPTSEKITLPDGAGFFSFICSANSGSIQINYSIQINKAQFTEEDYFVLKNFYSEILMKLTKPILFSKNT